MNPLKESLTKSESSLTQEPHTHIYSYTHIYAYTDTTNQIIQIQNQNQQTNLISKLLEDQIMCLSSCFFFTIF